MIQKNRYFSRSNISEAKFGEILRYFAMDLTATDCSELSGISVRSINTIYLRIRRRLAEHCAQISPLGGELEADESYFGPRRIRGLRGRGAGGKTVVFGLLKRVAWVQHRQRIREITRPDVYLEEIDIALDKPMNMASQVVARWLSDPLFPDADSNPKTPPRAEAGDGLGALVASVRVTFAPPPEWYSMRCLSRVWRKTRRLVCNCCK